MALKYASKEIVWAKIEPFPWWPGKIVNIHIQGEDIVYKILFFADPTYAYLKETHIRAFLEFDRATNSQCPAQSRLNRAIKMADQAYRRVAGTGGSGQEGEGRKNEGSAEGQSCSGRGKETQEMGMGSVGTGEERQQRADNEERKEVLAEAPITPSEEPILNFEEITKENILKILESRVMNQQRFEYNYDNRKRIIKHTGHLKRTLLQKYNLPLSDLQQESLIPAPRPHSKGKLRCRIHRKKGHLLHLPHLRQRCIKRLYLLARKSTDGQSSIDLKEAASSMVRRIFQLSEQNQLKYKSLYIALLKSLQVQGKGRCFEQRMCDFGLYLDRFESEKHEDEEGSKMTQISVHP